MTEAVRHLGPQSRHRLAVQLDERTVFARRTGLAPMVADVRLTVTDPDGRRRALFAYRIAVPAPYTPTGAVEAIVAALLPVAEHFVSPAFPDAWAAAEVQPTIDRLAGPGSPQPARSPSAIFANLGTDLAAGFAAGMAPMATALRQASAEAATALRPTVDVFAPLLTVQARQRARDTYTLTR